MGEEKTELEIAQEEAAAAFEAAMPPPGPLMAARIGDGHICPMLDGPKPHVGGSITSGFPTVMIGGMMAARVTDLVLCASPAPNTIVKGSATVMIGGMPAARFMDQTAHGGMIVSGCPTVIIGDVGMGKAVSTTGAAANLTALCPLIARLDSFPLAQRLHAEQVLLSLSDDSAEALAQLRHDRDLAVLAAAPYATSDGSPAVLPPGYAPASQADLDKLGLDRHLLNPDITVYSTTKPDGTPHYVMSYRGTELGAGKKTMANDIGVDLIQGAGMNTGAYRRGVDAARKAAGSGQSVELTGHSKGGGQAAAGSAASGLPASTYNAAGVHPRTLDRAGVSDQQRAATQENIRAYHNERDPLNKAQDNRGKVLTGLGIGAAGLWGWMGAAAVAALGKDGAIPPALGQRIPVPPAHSQGDGLAEGHSIDTMIQALNEQITEQLANDFGC